MAKRYVMVIDSQYCISCNACSVACKIENNLPDDIWWNRTFTVGGDHRDTPAGTYPNLTMESFTVNCQHCENPACVQVCPVGATYKDPETGIVRQDYDACIGCRMCMNACPYTGVRSFNWEEPKYTVGHAVGDAAVPAHQKHVVEKCQFCYHRVERGELPACIEACPARIRYFGDANDPTSEVAQLLRERPYKQLLPEKGTAPSVYFLL